MANQLQQRQILFSLLLLVGVFFQEHEAFSIGSRLGRTNNQAHPSLKQPSVANKASAPAPPSVALRSDVLRSGAFKEPTIWTKPFMKALLAEFLGTGLIVALGTGSVMSAVFTGELMGLFQIAAVWIIGVTIAIATTGPISGAHLNPAVSIALAYHRPTRDFGWDKVLPYTAAQTLGATFFSWMNYIMYSSTIAAYESANRIVRGKAASVATAKAFGEYFVSPVSAGTALLVETFGTAVLSFVIFSLTNPKNDCQKNKVFIPPIIGATVGGLICVLAPLTQAGFNPARDFGPRIVAGLVGWGSVAFKQWWVYVAGPIIGAVLGGALADKVLYADD